MSILRSCTVSLTLAATLAGTPALGHAAPASGIEVTPGTILGVDVVMPNNPGGPFELVQYDATGAVLGSVVLNDPYAIGVPTGVAILGADVFVVGNYGGVAQVDLDTGDLFGGFFIGQGAIESMGECNGDLLIASWYLNKVERRNREGILIDTINFAPGTQVTGLDSDGTNLYVGSGSDGDIHVYDLTGTWLHTIDTGLPADSISGLSYDRMTDTLWVTTGFDTDEILQIDMTGATVNSFPAGYTLLSCVARCDDPLILNAEPNFVFVGVDLEFDVYAGVPGNPVLHVVTSVSGAPFFVPLASGVFAGDGRFGWQAPVPPGLAPLIIGHRALAIDAAGKVVMSNEERVHHH